VDLARAHHGARIALGAGRLRAEALNLGGSRGASVRDVIETVERVAGVRPTVRNAPRRPGDPAILVASRSRAQESLGWSPTYDLEGIVRTAWNWHRRKRTEPGPERPSALS
jgi:UDP-glucose 4-epimerase